MNAVEEAPVNNEATVDRDRLVRENLGLVHHVARQLHRIYPAHADLDEMVSAGTIGLIRAVESFDPGRGLQFSTYAAHRIRGAIQDELRQTDHVARSLRRKERDVLNARDALRRVLGRAATSQEVAEHLGISLDTLWRWEQEISTIAEVSFSSSTTDSGSSALTLADVLPAETEETVEDRINASEEAEHLKQALLRLKEQERTVLSLYYFEELKLHEIATVLGLTESRIAQVRSKALAKLRGELAPLRAHAV